MRPKLTLALFCVSLGLFCIITLVIFNSDLVLALDEAVYRGVAPWVSPTWIHLSETISYLGQGNFLITLAVLFSIYFMVRGWVKEGLWYFAVILIGIEGNAVLKILFSRERPHAFNPDGILYSYAYPSGHTLGAFVTYLMTAWFVVKIHENFPFKGTLILSSLLMAGLVGFTRVTLGVHWASDVVGGSFLGLAWVFLNFFWLASFKFFTRPKLPRD